MHSDLQLVVDHLLLLSLCDQTQQYLCCHLIRYLVLHIPASLLSWYLVLKLACLHVSFKAYENFYKLSKMCFLLVLAFHFPIIRIQKSNNQTYIHLYTDFIIHKYICDRSLSGDPFHIVNPFRNAKGLFKCDSTHIPN